MNAKSAAIRCGAALGIVALLAGCTSYTLESLEPRPVTGSSGLLPLFITFAEAEPGVSVATDYATLFRRDLQSNVFLPDDSRWGYAELRVTFESTRVTGEGWVIGGAQIVTLAIPAFLGAPLTIKERTLQAEIAILDSHSIEVASYVITAKHRFPTWVWKDGEYRQAGTEAFKNVLDEFRMRLAEDVQSINDQLRAIGSLQ